MSLRPKYIVPCDIYQIDDSILREESKKESETRAKDKCKNCKFWMWKVGDIGVCKMTNQTVSASEFCYMFKRK
jgi:hypothetical protein